MKLIKCSSPGWEKDFDRSDELIDELRRNICGGCLAGSPGFLDDVVDVEYDGKFFECRDVNTLLSTPCGCEFEVKE